MSLQSPTWDVVVIGGGAAGLSGAVTLARSLRSVLIIDAGNPRNGPAGGVHNFISRDGMPSKDLLAIGRDELTSYGGTVLVGTALSVVKETDGFVVTVSDGQRIKARKLLVATGLHDGLPTVPGLQDHWGHGVLHCPYCHGWEVRGKALGVLGTSTAAAHQAMMFRQFSDDVILFMHTAPELTDEQWELLAALNIGVIEGTVAEITGNNDQLTGVRLESGESFARDALVIAPNFIANNEALVSLAQTAPIQPLGATTVGETVLSDESGATEIPGLWVAGNITDMYAGVINSAAAGFTAAAAINADLISEDAARAVAARRAAIKQSSDLTSIDSAQPDVFSAEMEAAVCEQILGDRRHGIFTEQETNE